MFFICYDALVTTRRLRSPVTLFFPIRARPTSGTPATGSVYGPTAVRHTRFAQRHPRSLTLETASYCYTCSRVIGLSVQPAWSTPHPNPTCLLSRGSNGLQTLTQAPLAPSGLPIRKIGPQAPFTAASCLLCQEPLQGHRRTHTRMALAQSWCRCPCLAAGRHRTPAPKYSRRAIFWAHARQLRHCL